MTEMIAGVDLVREQLRSAAGERLGMAQATCGWRAAPSSRVNAETLEPLPAQPRHAAPLPPARRPAGAGEAYAYGGCAIPVRYDPLLAKLVVWDETAVRAAAHAPQP